MERHRYRLIEKHKHWHGGRLYAAKDASAYKDEAVEDELSLTEEQAAGIVHKLELVDGAEALPEVAEKEKKVEEVVEPRVEPVTTAETVGVPEEVDTSSDDPDEPGTGNPVEGSKGDEGLDTPDKSEDSSDSLKLTMVAVKDGKYNVIHEGMPINDVPLSKEEAKSLMENS